MPNPPSSDPRERLRPIVPKLIELTEKVVFGDVWERPGLSKRDRSLITVATLTALYRPQQLRGHIARALANGVTKTRSAKSLLTWLSMPDGRRRSRRRTSQGKSSRSRNNTGWKPPRFRFGDWR